jgi:hypothetical protein
VLQLPAEALMINGLQQTRTKDAVHLDGEADDAAS